MPEEKEKWAEVKKAKEEFVLEQMKTGPFSEYVNMVGLTCRFIAEWLSRDPKRSAGEREKIKEELIQAGEDPEECVIHIGLRKPLPEGMSLPNIYKGFRVFVEVIGEIVLQ